MNFRQLDLNLLRVLAAIHRTRSVTAAGKTLALSQSATSNALGRLRYFFDDDLFVRSPGGLQPNVSVAADAVATALETREIDAAVGILQPRHRGVHAELLFREQYVAITSKSWRPAVGRAGLALSQEQLAHASFVVAAPTATFHSSVEQMLHRMKLSDRIALRTRHYGALPELALGTDLLAIVPQMYARDLSQRYEFRYWQLPQAPFYDVRLVWHSSTARDAAQQWMRALLKKLFERPQAEATPAKG